MVVKNTVTRFQSLVYVREHAEHLQLYNNYAVVTGARRHYSIMIMYPDRQFALHTWVQTARRSAYETKASPGRRVACCKLSRSPTMHCTCTCVVNSLLRSPKALQKGYPYPSAYPEGPQGMFLSTHSV